jgi:hypothetical protein
VATNSTGTQKLLSLGTLKVIGKMIGAVFTILRPDVMVFLDLAWKDQVVSHVEA